jgi:hypothetical protein
MIAPIVLAIRVDLGVLRNDQRGADSAVASIIVPAFSSFEQFMSVPNLFVLGVVIFSQDVER